VTCNPLLLPANFLQLYTGRFPHLLSAWLGTSVILLLT
jgi:hypothetical protein